MHNRPHQAWNGSKPLYVRPTAKMFTLVNRLTCTQLMTLKTTFSCTCKRLGIEQSFQAQGRIEVVVKGRFSDSVCCLPSCFGDYSKWTEKVKTKTAFRRAVIADPFTHKSGCFIEAECNGLVLYVCCSELRRVRLAVLERYVATVQRWPSVV